jgi:hypothetical protein
MKQQYKLYTYDVWGNARDGFEVNDFYAHGTITINVKPETYNKGSPHEFTSHEPTSLQLSRAVGVRGVEWEGESGYALYATKKSNGKPVCERRRVKE